MPKLASVGYEPALDVLDGDTGRRRETEEHGQCESPYQEIAGGRGAHIFRPPVVCQQQAKQRHSTVECA